MGKLNYYAKTKIKLMLLIIFINICFVIAVHFIVANNERDRLYNDKDVSTASSLALDAFILFNDLDNKAKTAYEVYEALYQKGFHDKYLSWYMQSTNRKFIPSIYINHKDEFIIDNSFLLTSAVYKDDYYVGFIDYEELFGSKELASFYQKLRHATLYEGTINISGIQTDEGKIYPNILSATTISNEIVVDEFGNKNYQDVIKEEFKYEFSNSAVVGKNINLEVSNLSTPLYNPITKQTYEYKNNSAETELKKASSLFYSGHPGEWIETNEGRISSLLVYKDIIIESYDDAIMNWNDNIFVGYALFSNVMRNAASSLVYFDLLVAFILIPIYYLIANKLINMLSISNHRDEEQRRKLTIV